MRKVRVVAAVIRRGGSVLITQRRPEADRGGLWEFPGGKVERGEAEPEALRREIAEELACDVAVGPLLVRHEHRYPDLEVELAFYDCALPPDQVPRPLGVAALDWAPAETLEMYPFCEADIAVLGAIAREVVTRSRGSR